MISVILFDVGNVLLTFTPESYYRPLLAAEKYEETMQLLFNTQHWNHYDQGLHTEEELKNFSWMKPLIWRQKSILFLTPT